MMIKHEADVVVIGGGAIGAAVTFFLAREGKKVTLIECNELASGASGANAAFAWTTTRKPGNPMEMALDSIEFYNNAFNELPIDIEYKRCGGLMLISTEEQIELLKPWVETRQKAGLTELRIIDHSELCQIEPFVAEQCIAATYNPLDGRINPMFLVLAFADAAKKYGAIIHEHTRVEKIIVKKNEIRGIITDKGEISAPYVVNAAGAYASEVGEMVNLQVPIIPNRMQLIVTEPLAPFIDRVMMGAEYVTAEDTKVEKIERGISDKEDAALIYSQTEKGNLILGSTTEFVGFNKCTTYNSIHSISNEIIKFMPSLYDTNIIRTFANFFPFTTDDDPILGNVEGLKGFIMAAGHNGHGIVHAASTGKIIMELIVYGETSLNFDINELNLSRFDKVVNT